MDHHYIKSNHKVNVTINRVGRVGLFVSLNSSQEGFIHISEIHKSTEKQTTEGFKSGQQVTAWVMNYNPDTNRLALTMIDPQSTVYLDQLKPGQKLQGIVVGIEDFGAFVDVNAKQTGLVHISRLSRIPVNKVTDIVNEGDRVTVWVEKVDIRRQHLNLSLLPPPSLDWTKLWSGQQLNGTVITLTDFGAFVDIDAEIAGLVHKSEMSHSYVTDPSKIVSIGQSVRVRVVEVNIAKKRISLSLK